MTATPGPRAMRASKARQVTATTCPLVDIQRSFCSRSASGYFVGNLPQKVKLVNGLTLDLPIRAGRVASETRRVRAPVRARIATFSLARSAAFRRSRQQYRATSLWTPLMSRAPMPFCWPQSSGAPERTGYKSRSWLDMPRAAELECPKPHRTPSLAQIPQGACELEKTGAARK